MTPAQILWLRKNHYRNGRWLYSHAAKPMIDELCAAGEVEPARGELAEIIPTGRTIICRGEVVEVFDVLNVYRLTDVGSLKMTWGTH